MTEIKKGYAFLIPMNDPNSEERSRKKHLFFALTNPYEGKILLVSISTLNQSGPYDTACILRRGDHPFVQHDSFVFYERARILRVDKIIESIKNGDIQTQRSLGDTTLQRVCQGIEISEDVRSAILEFYKLASS